jgi:hypothetical protein
MKRRLRRFNTARAERPLGAADCFKTQFSGNCSKCGADTARLHVPTRLVPGKFCEGCCPACSAPGLPPSEAPTEPPRSTRGTQ